MRKKQSFLCLKTAQILSTKPSSRDRLLDELQQTIKKERFGLLDLPEIVKALERVEMPRTGETVPCCCLSDTEVQRFYGQITLWGWRKGTGRATGLPYLEVTGAEILSLSLSCHPSSFRHRGLKQRS